MNPTKIFIGERSVTTTMAVRVVWDVDSDFDPWLFYDEIQNPRTSAGLGFRLDLARGKDRVDIATYNVDSMANPLC